MNHVVQYDPSTGDVVSYPRPDSPIVHIASGCNSANGFTIRASEPIDSIGRDGWYWLDTRTGDLYQRVNGTYA